MGLGYGYGDSVASVVIAVGDDEDVKRRNLLAHAGTIIFGEAVLGQPSLIRAAFSPTPEFGKIGSGDIVQLKSATTALRKIDRQYGGAGIVNLVVAAYDRGETLMKSASNEAVRKKLAGALADLGQLCGWVTNDVGLGDVARAAMFGALDYAAECGDREIISTTLRVTGRIEGHRGDPNYALKFLQLAEVDATHPGKSTIKADQAKLYAQMGLTKQACEALAACENSCADVAGVTGEAKLLLGEADSAYEDLMAASGDRDSATARSAAIEKTLLATLYLQSGEKQGLRLAADAISAVKQLPGSVRTKERLEPAIAELDKIKSDDAAALAIDARELFV